VVLELNSSPGEVDRSLVVNGPMAPQGYGHPIHRPSPDGSEQTLALGHFLHIGRSFRCDQRPIIPEAIRGGREMQS
jgi:hypothetical protein